MAYCEKRWRLAKQIGRIMDGRQINFLIGDQKQLSLEEVYLLHDGPKENIKKLGCNG